MSVEPVPYHDEQSLIAAAEELGKKALKSGLISSFVVRHFRDSSQFYIPDDHQEPFTPEQAYMKLKSLLERSSR